jgi:hypothetical protein
MKAPQLHTCCTPFSITTQRMTRPDITPSLSHSTARVSHLAHHVHEEVRERQRPDGGAAEHVAHGQVEGVAAAALALKGVVKGFSNMKKAQKPCVE